MNEYICSVRIEDNHLSNVVFAENEKIAIDKFCKYLRGEVGYVNPICVCCADLIELMPIKEDRYEV